MWIISGKMFQKFFDMVSGNLSSIERQLIFNRQVKVHTTQRLIKFQNKIEFINYKLHQYNKLLIISDARAKTSIMIQIKSLKNILIMYISAWSINLKQDVIKSNTIKVCLGNLLLEEKRMLEPSLNKLIHLRGQNYTDALNCKWLFNTVLS